MKIIEVITHRDHIDLVENIAREHGAVDQWHASSSDEDERQVMRLLFDDSHRQAVMDALQSILVTHDITRIVVMSVEAILPQMETVDKEKEKSSSQGATREELYHSISKNAELNSNFLLLVFLSTIVASIGLI